MKPAACEKIPEDQTFPKYLNQLIWHQQPHLFFMDLRTLLGMVRGLSRLSSFYAECEMENLQTKGSLVQDEAEAVSVNPELWEVYPVIKLKKL